MANFPVSLDTGSSLPTPTSGNNTNNPSHSALHGAENAAIIATETKLGIGATTSAANQLLVGTGAGTSAWQGLTSAQLLAILSDETGTGAAVFANTPVLITPKVDTINENTGGNGVTVGGVNLKSGAISTSNSVPTAALQSSAVTSDKVATGMPVQVVSTSYSAVATGSTTIPFDDTIPQNTEGDQYMTQSITPKSATNILVIEAHATVSNSFASGQTFTTALFQDSTANALAATNQYMLTATAPIAARLTHSMVAGTTSSTTFKIRIGCDSAGTTTFNGQSGTRRMGGITMSNIKIIEYKA